MGDYLILVAIEVDTVCRLYRPVKSVMGTSEVCRHVLGIVEVGKRLALMRNAGVENRLRAALDVFSLRFRRAWPYEVVVDDGVGVLVVAL